MQAGHAARRKCRKVSGREPQCLVVDAYLAQIGHCIGRLTATSGKPMKLRIALVLFLHSRPPPLTVQLAEQRCCSPGLCSCSIRMFKFVLSTPNGVSCKRKQTQRACESCRKRKVSETESQIVTESFSNSCRDAVLMLLVLQTCKLMIRITST